VNTPTTEMWPKLVPAMPSIGLPEFGSCSGAYSERLSVQSPGISLAGFSTTEGHLTAASVAWHEGGPMPPFGTHSISANCYCL
jgi:hypothetical protein